MMALICIDLSFWLPMALLLSMIVFIIGYGVKHPH